MNGEGRRPLFVWNGEKRGGWVCGWSSKEGRRRGKGAPEVRRTASWRRIVQPSLPIVDPPQRWFLFPSREKVDLTSFFFPSQNLKITKEVSWGVCRVRHALSVSWRLKGSEALDVTLGLDVEYATKVCDAQARCLKC